MRVDNVNQSKGVGYIKFNTDTEMDLIAESMNRLIAKQLNIVERTGKREDGEINKLARFQVSKEKVIEIPKQNRMRLKSIKENVKTKHDKENKRKLVPDGLGGWKDEIVDVEDTEEFKNMSRTISDAEVGSGIGEGTEVTHRDMHVLANALNNHIWEMEQNDFYKKTRRNQNKYDELVQMLQNVQEQKAKFERVRPKPKGFGRLRK